MSKPQICCPNPNCVAPLNSYGSLVCESCQTALIYRYLWAVGRLAEPISLDRQIAGRYYVAAPQIWLDTQPSLPPDVPSDWPEDILPYLHLYPFHLHIPEVYGFCPAEAGIPANSIVLLENAPIDNAGLLYPAIAQAWTQASAVRQLYWLWQLLELWAPLLEQGVAASLLAASNIRVEGWRVRLCQLYRDVEVLPAPEPGQPALELSLGDLANLWMDWVSRANPAIIQPLTALCYQMQAEGTQLATVLTQLNALLIEQAARLPLHLQVAGITDPGPTRSHNEDTCYPLTVGDKRQADDLMGRFAIVCDGIGGHEGGEVASQLAVQSLKLQAQALLAEVAEQLEVVQPELLMQQLAASIRVVNNLIAAQNDSQGRVERRRMGTTLVMALQVPQQVRTAEEFVFENGHELYLAHVGDSRAYWITRHYCHQLTVDDDVSVREVRLGRSLHWESLRRPDAGALTQAIGTRDAESLHPTIQRFIVEEEGVLLLCSDGLSDNGLIEQSWTEVVGAFFDGKQTLEETAQTWTHLANQRNGYDNTSLVLLHCDVAVTPSALSLPVTPAQAALTRISEWSPASRALLEEPGTVPSALEDRMPVKRQSRSRLLLLGVLALLLLTSGLGLLAWSQRDPNGFQQFRERVAPQPPKS